MACIRGGQPGYAPYIMDAAVIKIGYFVFDLIMPLAVGWAMQRQRRLGKNFFDTMIFYNIMVIYPLLGVLSFWVISLDRALLWLPVLGVVMQVIPGVVAYWRVGKFQDSLEQGSYLLSAILSNTLTLGGLAVFILYGPAGYAYAQLIVLLNNVVLFMFCFPLAQYYYAAHVRGRASRPGWCQVLFNRNQLPVLGLLAGILLNVWQVPRPPAFDTIFNIFVHFSAWTALLPVGYALEIEKIGQYWRSIIDLNVIKFIITPLGTYLLARLVLSDPVVLRSLVIVAATPTAINAVITVQLHHLNIHVAMAAFVLTTALYLLLVYPLLFYWYTVVAPL